MQPCIRKYSPSEEFYIDEGCYITELSNSEDDPTVSIARARVKKGVTTKLHCLSEIIERYVILEGEGLVELDGAAPQKVGPCDVVIIPSGSAQKITNIDAIDLIFLAICSPKFTSIAYKSLEE